MFGRNTKLGLQKFSKQFNPPRASLSAARVSLASLSMIALIGCSQASRPKSAAQQGVLAPQPTVEKDQDSTRLKEEIGPTESQSTRLLQDSIARVLGFVDVYGKSVTLYQDTYSALYDNLGRQASSAAGSVADPLFYYSPVFIPDTPKLLLLPSGELNVTIDNLATSTYIRKRIASKLAVTLQVYKIDPNKINMLKLVRTSGKLNAFNKSYDVNVDKDFGRLTVIIPKSDVPSGINSALKASPDGALFNKSFEQYFSSLPLTYAYYVQHFTEQECHFNIDDKYVRDMFSDSKCEVPNANVVKEPGTEASVTNALNRTPGLTSFPGDKKAQVVDILNKTTNPITACMMANEKAELTQRASIKCTKQAKDTAGNKTDFDAQINNFLATIAEPAIGTKRFDPYSTANWDVQAVSAAIRLFESPEKFKSEMTSFNEELQNAIDDGAEKISSESTKNFRDVMEQMGDFRDTSSGSSKESIVGGNLSFGGFGGGLTTGSGSTRFDKAISDVVAMGQTTDAANVEKKSQDIFKTYGMDHVVKKLDGKFYFYPSINVSVKANVDKVTKSAGNMSTTELGDIFVEEYESTVQLARREPLNLVFRLPCGDNAKSFTFRIEQADWFEDDAPGGFWDTANKRMTEYVKEAACPTFQIFAYYEGAAANPSLVPKSRMFSVIARVPGDPNATPAIPNKLKSAEFELLSTSAKGAEAATAPVTTGDNSRTFSDLRIEF